jgi:hypothetical protein
VIALLSDAAVGAPKEERAAIACTAVPPPKRSKERFAARAFSDLTESEGDSQAWANHDSRWGLVLEAGPHDQTALFGLTPSHHPGR